MNDIWHEEFDFEFVSIDQDTELKELFYGVELEEENNCGTY